MKCLAHILPVGFLGVLLGTALAGEPPSPSKPGKDDAARLKTVVVTATRTEKSLFDVPNAVEVLTAEDLQHRRMVRTVPEALREMPGVMVQKTGHGQGSPYIRGFTGFRTLFLVDGIRLNNSVFRDGPNQYWNTVDPLTIKRLEVVKGPGSVLYGSDAVGGTVNAITRSREKPADGSLWERRLYYRFASAEDANTGRGETSWELPGGRTEFLVGASLKDFGDVDAGEDVGLQPKTGYKEWNADIKVEHHLTDNSRLVLAHQSVGQRDAWRSHKTLYGISWEGTAVGNEKKRALDQERRLTYLQFHAEELGAFIDTLRASVSFQEQDEQQYRRRSDDRRDTQGVEVDTFGAWLQLESPSPIGRLTYGFDCYLDRVESFKRKYNADGSFDEETIQGPVGDNARYDLLGLYVQNEIEATDALTLTFGLRWTYAEADAGQVEDPDTGNRISISDDWDALVGSARFVYRLDQAEHWHVFGGVSQGFRAPNLSDLTRLDTARSNEIETPSPDLDPEKFVSYELGLKTRYDNWSAQAAYFYTDIRDMIVRTPTGNIISGDNEVTKQNAGDGFVHGVELGGSYRFHPEFSVFGSFTWMDGEVDTYPTAAPDREREPIDRLMPATGNLGLRWDHLTRNYWVEGVLAAAGEADDLSTRDEADTQRIPPGGTPGYVVLTLRGGWQINDNLRLSVAVENLTNEDYRIHGSGQNEPGTNVVLGIDWRF